MFCKKSTILAEDKMMKSKKVKQIKRGKKGGEKIIIALPGLFGRMPYPDSSLL